MTLPSSKKIALVALTLTIALALLSIPAPRTNAADHGDSPSADDDRTADLDDAFIFLDPNDNRNLIVSWTWLGFITPAEGLNFGTFDSAVEFRAEFETTGDAIPDKFINVHFEPRPGPAGASQDVTITLPDGSIMKAKTTLVTTATTPPPRIITTDPNTGIKFFAGDSDDPFYFDIPGFARYLKQLRDTCSTTAGCNKDTTFLQRGRDSFAGYNVLSLAFSIPNYRQVLGLTGNVIGLQVVSRRQAVRIFNPDKRDFIVNGQFFSIDRNATPAINTFFVPFARKNEFNFSNPLEDSQGRFKDDINASFRALGTTQPFIDIIDAVAINNGDLLRLDVTIPNTSVGVNSLGVGEKIGDPGYAGFPNGRRPGDDVVDTLLFLINNGTPLSDNVNKNDKPYESQFPFFGLPHQPLVSGCDTTQN